MGGRIRMMTTAVNRLWAALLPLSGPWALTPPWTALDWLQALHWLQHERMRRQGYREQRAALEAELTRLQSGR